jgi:16S rRNA (cytosine1402-N4)-methyltransferase
VVSLIQPRGDGVYVDCTVGFGGHAAALLDAGAGRLIGLDRDESALALAASRLGSAAGRVELVHADYRDLPKVLRERRLDGIDGAIADLGVSSMQLDDPERGFSFRQDGPLDMRMDRSSGVPVAELIRASDEATLADVIFRFGEERHARRVARAIVRARERQPLTRTGELASVVRRAAGGRGWQRIDPATRTFQALRIWVNRELDGLDGFIDAAVAALRVGGRLAMIAFHSLEDRVVKQAFARMRVRDAEIEGGKAVRVGEGALAVRLLTRKPVTADDDEVRRNPRARSARLRAVERLA